MKNLIIALLLVFISSTVFSQKFIDKDLQARTDGWGLIDVQNDGSETIFLIGNSICNGYKSYAAEVLKGYRVLAWVSPFHLLEKGLYNDMRKVMKDEKIALVHFNNGLHGWEKGVIPENKYEFFLQSFVDSVKLFSKGAKLIWASTTPITTAKTEDGQPVTFDPENNPTITGRNNKAKKVMQKNHIPLNDLYSVCAANLPMSVGDKFHWNKEMYQKLGLQVGKMILRELEK